MSSLNMPWSECEACSDHYVDADGVHVCGYTGEDIYDEDGMVSCSPATQGADYLTMCGYDYED